MNNRIHAKLILALASIMVAPLISAQDDGFPCGATGLGPGAARHRGRTNSGPFSLSSTELEARPTGPHPPRHGHAAKPAGRSVVTGALKEEEWVPKLR